MFFSVKSLKQINVQFLVVGFIMMILCVSFSFAQSRNKGGVVTPTPTPINPLPTTPPSPDIVYRDSFGLGPNISRPTGGKGAMKDTYLHTNINSFWLEYPGSKNTQWKTPDAVETWRFCAATENPFELFSPLQTYQGLPSNGCVASEWFEVPVTNPTALMPITAPSVPYELSMEGYPSAYEQKYLALGLTNSALLTSNLQTAGSLVLSCAPTVFAGFDIKCDLHSGSINGPILNSVTTANFGWNQYKLRVDPINQTVGASVNGFDLGTFPVNIGSPKYAAFEGVGILDDFVIRKL